MTISVCVPSTCIGSGSCSTQEQATHVAYQIARAAALFHVVEVVVVQVDSEQNAERLACLLESAVTPRCLWKAAFSAPVLRSLGYAKRLPLVPNLPVQARTKNPRFVEGVAVRAHQRSKARSAVATTSYINIGQAELFRLGGKRNSKRQNVPVGSRVTVDVVERRVVSPRVAYKDHGGNYGFNVRLERGFGSVFTQSPHPDGYAMAVYVPSQRFFSHDCKDTLSLVPVVGEDRLAQASDKARLLVVGALDEYQDSLRGTDVSVHTLLDGRLATSPATRTEDVVLVALDRLHR